MTAIKLNLGFGIKNEFTKGTKRVNVIEFYDGNRRVVRVYYYDTHFDEISMTQGCCCQAPSDCKNEASAIRMINRFFRQ